MTEPRVRLDVEAHKAWLDGEPLRMTNLQFQLLACLATREGRTVASDQIMLAVWGVRWTRDVKTLAMHISHLRKTIGFDTIATVRGVGYRLEPGTVEVIGRRDRTAPVRELCEQAVAGVEAGWVNPEVGKFATQILAALEVADG